MNSGKGRGWRSAPRSMAPPAQPSSSRMSDAELASLMGFEPDMNQDGSIGYGSFKPIQTATGGLGLVKIREKVKEREYVVRA